MLCLRSIRGNSAVHSWHPSAMNGPVANVNKMVFFLEHLSTSYIREIWFPKREHNKVFTAVFVLRLCATRFFIVAKNAKLVHRGQPYSMCVCVCVCVYTWLYIYIYIYIYMFLYTWKYIYIYICVCVCVCVDTRGNIYIYIYIYIYTHTQTCLTFTGPYIVIYSDNEIQRDALFLIFI